MGEQTDETTRPSRGGDSASFLVRLWREPHAKGDGPVRVYLRNLQTGEELYFGNPRRIGEILSLEAETFERTRTTDESQARVS